MDILVISSGQLVEMKNLGNDLGLFVENYVFNYLKRLQLGEIDFWRERQVREVDFIYDYQSTKLPIEVKYQNQIRPEDLKNISYYCNKEKLNRAVVITKNKIGVEKLKDLQIQFIPAHYLVEKLLPN